MPRATKVPKLCRHKASGNAYVTDPDLGKEVYFGPHGSDAANEAYRAWAAAYLARRAEAPVPARAGLTVSQLALAYLAHADVYYTREGKRASEARTIAGALRPLADLFGLLPAAQFGPAELRAVRDAYLAKGWARQYVNQQVGRLRAAFRWGAGQGLLPGEMLAALEAVAPLRRGRASGAREEEPVQPVPAGVVEATLPHLSPARLRVLVCVHLYSAMRPQEAVQLRPCDIAQEEGSRLWLFRPAHWKTEWRGGPPRTIHLGPRAQEGLRPLLEGADADAWLFPALRRPGEHLSVEGYRRAVERACRRAGVERWAPLQLRHTALTEVRRLYGLEGAQVRAGHARADVTQVYAERDDALARRIAEEMG